MKREEVVMSEVRIWKKEDIKDLLVKRDDAVVQGMLRIFDLQTADEKESETAKHSNGVGFSGAHAEIMCSMSKFYNRRNFLSPKQMVCARKIMLRYAGQLTLISNGKI